MASGMAPKSAAKVVIMIGRKRSCAASKIASSGRFAPLLCVSIARSIMMMAFFLTMPISRITPIIAMMLSSLPKSISASSAPTPAEGSVERMVMGCTRLS